MREQKIAATPVYGFESAWRDPYALKYRSATVGIPCAVPAHSSSSSWSRLVMPYTLVGRRGVSSSVGSGVSGCVHDEDGQIGLQSPGDRSVIVRGFGYTTPWAAQ